MDICEVVDGVLVDVKQVPSQVIAANACLLELRGTTGWPHFRCLQSDSWGFSSRKRTAMAFHNEMKCDASGGGPCSGKRHKPGLRQPESGCPQFPHCAPTTTKRTFTASTQGTNTNANSGSTDLVDSSGKRRRMRNIPTKPPSQPPAPPQVASIRRVVTASPVSSAMYETSMYEMAELWETMAVG